VYLPFSDFFLAPPFEVAMDRPLFTFARHARVPDLHTIEALGQPWRAWELERARAAA
jgi:hypothetical protein